MRLNSTKKLASSFMGAKFRFCQEDGCSFAIPSNGRGRSYYSSQQASLRSPEKCQCSLVEESTSSLKAHFAVNSSENSRHWHNKSGDAVTMNKYNTMPLHVLQNYQTYLRKCSTSTLGSTGVRWYSSRSGNESTLLSTEISSSSSSSSNRCDGHKPVERNNNSNDLVENTQTQWVFHPQSGQEWENCSTVTKSKDVSSPANRLTRPSTHQSTTIMASEVATGRLTKSSGSSIPCQGSSVVATSSPSAGQASTSAVFAAMAAATAGNSNFTPVRTVVTSQRLVEVTGDNIMEPKLLSKEEREEFMRVYHDLVKDLSENPDMKDMAETNRWMSRVLQYNVPHGKRNRGLSTALAYKYLAPEELTQDNVRLSYVLGWCVEILQAFFLVSDDIMDESETRRGRPCWYKVDNLGLAAINDALLLESAIYQIIRKHFRNKPYYVDVIDVMHDVTHKTVCGQSLDTRTGQDRKMETYTLDRYTSIVKYKTSYYSFYLPVALAMAMCEITDPNLFQQMRTVTLEMGHYFQVQDDYLDCFGDIEVTGKVGTDIQDCKCSWLFVVAMQRCTQEQKKFLLDNYGRHNPEQIEAVKKLYRELDMVQAYRTYEEQTFNMIDTHIQQMSDELPKGLFQDMLQKIYKRSS